MASFSDFQPENLYKEYFVYIFLVLTLYLNSTVDNLVKVVKVV